MSGGAPPPSGETAFSGWRIRALVYSVALSAVGYLAFSLLGGWQDVSAAVVRVGLSGVLAALSLSLVNYGLRFVRWQAYLGAMGHAVPRGAGLRIYLAGFALTTTPGKAGEMLRGVYLKRWGVPYPRSFAAFFSERLSDLLAIVLLALFGLSAYPDAGPAIGAGAVLVALVLAALSSERLLERVDAWFRSRAGPVGAVARHAVLVLHETRRCHSARLMAGATALSVTAWFAEALAFHLVLGWMGADVALPFAVFVYAIGMLAGALSFMPGGLGGTEATMVALLLWKGLGGADAVAATVLIRLATLWFAVAIGVVTALRLPK